MNQEPGSIRQRMRTPRSAGIAGIIFAFLFSTSHLIMWVSIPASPLGPATAAINRLNMLSFSTNLMPFAGIAFLWFLAVVRDHLGEFEDRFFGTVFLGSGLLFVAMVFSAGAVEGGTLTVLGRRSEKLIQGGAYAFGRAEIAQIMHIYAMKVAAVFMTTTSTISIQTRLFPRWMAFLGYALALALLLNVGTFVWTPLVFPF